MNKVQMTRMQRPNPQKYFITPLLAESYFSHGCSLGKLRSAIDNPESRITEGLSVNKNQAGRGMT